MLVLYVSLQLYILTMIHTAVGVDALDKKRKCYKTARRSRRWSATVCYRIMDIADIKYNAIYNLIGSKDIMARRIFLTRLGRQVINKHMVHRRREREWTLRYHKRD